MAVPTSADIGGGVHDGSGTIPNTNSNNNLNNNPQNQNERRMSQMSQRCLFGVNKLTNDNSIGSSRSLNF
jgi:hypothetical protein